MEYMAEMIQPAGGQLLKITLLRLALHDTWQGAAGGQCFGVTCDSSMYKRESERDITGISFRRSLAVWCRHPAAAH